MEKFDNSSFPSRWDDAPDDVELLEAEWWKRFSWLEDEYAWVHPPDVRHILRRGYLEHIISSIPKDGTIIDYGCGPGWLAILLAQLGAKNVIGVDNAPAQIEIAEKKAKESGQDQKIVFHKEIAEDEFQSADAVIVHGVLHHLSWNQIDEFIERLHRNVPNRCKIFILEPVQGKSRYLPWSLPWHLFRLSAKYRKQGPEEKRVRLLLDSRGDGPRYSGHGVSPKEMPFQVGELEKRLAHQFEIPAGRPVLFFSVRVAMELVLLSKTHPRLAAVCTRLLLPLYMAWERLSFVFAPAGLWSGWVFCLFEATPKR
jgi:SAM-dependent methyltransferase